MYAHYRGADIDPDHFLVGVKMRLPNTRKTKRTQNQKKKKTIIRLEAREKQIELHIESTKNWALLYKTMYNKHGA